MSYLGAFKSWVYGPVLRAFGVGLWTLREPMLLAGLLSIALFYLMLRRAAGNRAAAIGTVLLAVDGQYLLTACFDWGPVALQHVLLLGGAVLLVRFYQERREWALAAGSFLLGVALWDKALAVWMLSGLAVGGILTFPRQILGLITPRRAAIAAAALLLGALPLVVYNAENHWDTFHGNFQRDTKDVPGKALFLVHTFGGSGLFGWMTAEGPETPQPHQPATATERAAAGISALFGHPRNSLLLYAFLLAIVIAPLAGGVNFRLVLWALIAMAVAWIQMAINQNTGGSIHHTILLWPLPQFVIAISYAGASRRLGRAAIPALTAAVAVVAVSGVLVINEYYCMMVRNGGAQAWNDGILAVGRYFQHPPSYDYAFAMDWGILDPLRLLERGRLRLAVGTDQISNAVLSAQDQAYVKQMVSNPKNLFIAHTPGFEVFKGNNKKLQDFAAAGGFVPETLRRISDSRGRDAYEIYRFVPK